MERLLSARDVGTLLGITERTARRYMRDGMACILLPGGDIRVEATEVEQWTKKHREAPASTSSAPRVRTMPSLVPPELFEPDGKIKRRRKKQ